MPERAPAGARGALRLSAAIVALCAAAAAALHVAGRAARAPRADPGPGPGAPALVVARTASEAIAAWRARGLRGRTLVHAGRFLHFVPEGADLVIPTLSRPGRGTALDDALAARAGPRGYLWAASSLGIARRVLYVMPPAALASRLEALGADRRALPIRLGDSQAFSRTLLPGFPDGGGEPVVLDVHASFLDEATAPELLSALDAAGLRVELVTLELAEDADDVGAAARDRLREVERALRARGARGDGGAEARR